MDARAHFAAALSILTGVSSVGGEDSGGAVSGAGGGGGAGSVGGGRDGLMRGPSLLAPPPLFPVIPFDSVDGCVSGGSGGGADGDELENTSVVSSPPYSRGAAVTAAPGGGSRPRRRDAMYESKGGMNLPSNAELANWAAAAASGAFIVSRAPSSMAAAALLRLRHPHAVPIVGAVPDEPPGTAGVLLTAIPAGGVRLAVALDAESRRGERASPLPVAVARWAAGLASVIAASSLAGVTVSVHPTTVWLVPREGRTEEKDVPPGSPTPAGATTVAAATAAELWLSAPDAVDAMLDTAAAPPPLSATAPYLAPESLARRRAGAAAATAAATAAAEAEADEDSRNGGDKGSGTTTGLSARAKAVLAAEAASVYALGMVVWELLVGSPPWAGVRTSDIYARGTIRGDPPPGDPRRLAAAPTAVTRVVAACTARRPPQRLRAAAAADAFSAAAEFLGGIGERRRATAAAHEPVRRAAGVAAPSPAAADGGSSRAAAAMAVSAVPSSAPTGGDEWGASIPGGGGWAATPRRPRSTRPEAAAPAAAAAAAASVGTPATGVVRRRALALDAAAAAEVAAVASLPPVGGSVALAVAAAARPRHRGGRRGEEAPSSPSADQYATNRVVDDAKDEDDASEYITVENPGKDSGSVSSSAASSAAAAAGTSAPLPPLPTPSDRTADCDRLGLPGELWGGARGAATGDSTRPTAPTHRRGPSLGSVATDAATCFSCDSMERFGGIPAEGEGGAGRGDDSPGGAATSTATAIVAATTAAAESSESSSDDASDVHIAGGEAAAQPAESKARELDDTLSSEDEEAALLRRLAEVRKRKRAAAAAAAMSVTAPRQPEPRRSATSASGSPPPPPPAPCHEQSMDPWPAVPSPVVDSHATPHLSLPSSPTTAVSPDALAGQMTTRAPSPPRPTLATAAAASPSAADMMLSGDSWAEAGVFDDADWDHTGARAEEADAEDAEDELGPAPGVVGAERPRLRQSLARRRSGAAAAAVTAASSAANLPRRTVSDLHGYGSRLGAVPADRTLGVATRELSDSTVSGAGAGSSSGEAGPQSGFAGRRPIVIGVTPVTAAATPDTDPLLPRFEDVSTPELGGLGRSGVGGAVPPSGVAARFEKTTSEGSLLGSTTSGRAGGRMGGPLAKGSLDDLRRSRTPGGGSSRAGGGGPSVPGSPGSDNSMCISKDVMLSRLTAAYPDDAFPEVHTPSRGVGGRSDDGDGGPPPPSSIWDAETVSSGFVDVPADLPAAIHRRGRGRGGSAAGQGGAADAVSGGGGGPLLRPPSTVASASGGGGRAVVGVRERKARAAHALRALSRPPHCDDVETVATAAAVLQKVTAPRSQQTARVAADVMEADASVRGFIVDMGGVETLLATLTRFHAAARRKRMAAGGSFRSISDDASGVGGGAGSGVSRVTSGVGLGEESLGSAAGGSPPDDVAALCCFVLLAVGNLVAWDVRAYAVFMGATGGGVRTVVRIMIHWQNHAGVQERGCYALACASLGFPVRSKDVFSTSRAVDVVVRALALALRSSSAAAPVVAAAGGGGSRSGGPGGIAGGRPGAGVKQAAAALVGMLSGCPANGLQAGKRGAARRIVAAFDALRRTAVSLRKHGDGLLLARALLALLDAPANVREAASVGAAAVLLRAAEEWCLPPPPSLKASVSTPAGGLGHTPADAGAPSGGAVTATGGSGAGGGPNADFAARTARALTALTFSASAAQDVLEGAVARILPALMRAHAADAGVISPCLHLTRALLRHARRAAVFPCVRNGLVEALVSAIRVHGLGLPAGDGGGGGGGRGSIGNGHTRGSDSSSSGPGGRATAKAAVAPAGGGTPTGSTTTSAVATLDGAAAIAADACLALTALCAEVPPRPSRRDGGGGDGTLGGSGGGSGPAPSAERSLLAARLRTSHAEAAVKAVRAAHRRNTGVAAAAAAREAAAAIAALRKSIGSEGGGRMQRLLSART
ncbi:hypothetical protein MMPV_006536 [Pyropia vietnamensis]